MLRLSRPDTPRGIAIAILLFGGGASCLWGLGVFASKVENPPPVLKVAGVPVDVHTDPVASALDLVRRYASGEITLELPDGTSKKIRRSALGIEINRVRLADFVREALRPKGTIARLVDKKDAELEVPIPLGFDEKSVVDKLLAIKAEVDRPAEDAHVDLEHRRLLPDKKGIYLDVYGTLARIEAALRAGKDKVEASVETTEPKLKAETLGNVEFSEVLGYFETHYTLGEKAKNRTYNLRLAASKLDGTIVMPGDIFDFNATVGPRDEAHGFRVAPVIAEGELVDGLGGGTCQVSGTLHGAAFFAGLEIVQRYPHSRPSYYIKLGLDATVVYPTINYRFRNSFEYPIVLHETVSNGIIRAEILGPKRTHTVSYFRRIDEVVPFDEVERDNPKLPEGQRVISQRGIPGLRTTSSRVVREGAYAIREKWSDTYPPTTQIVSVGTGPRDIESKAKEDEHPEYIVDEYLVITQGPEIRSPGATGREPGGGTIESREPGKTGVRGWTENLASGKTEDDEEEPKHEAKPAKTTKGKPAPRKNEKGKASGKKG